MIANKCIEVDLDGLRKQLARKGPTFVAWELVQNALDAPGTTQVTVTLETIPGRPAIKLVVEDNSPQGFTDLSHAWTLFAPSEKKGNPEQRGFMNLGEKLALSMCESARIETVTGGVRFDVEGRHTLRSKRERGTRVEMILRMTHADGAQIVEDLRTQTIRPAGVSMTVNGWSVERSERVADYEQELPTRIADEEGYLRATRRKTRVALHPVAPGDHARLYEMGIPVVEVECQWHIDIHQKVPLNSDRDNVTPAYLREVYSGVLNHTAHLIKGEDAAQAWVSTALESPDVSPSAVQTVLDHQYGARRVVADPSDPEGTKLAASKGYTVIPGNAFSKAAWENVRRFEAALPAGRVTPSPKAYSEQGEALQEVPRSAWTPEQEARVEFCKRLAQALLEGKGIYVRLVNQFGWNYGATYGPTGTLTINIAQVGKAWFHLPHYDERVMGLLVHEFGHEDCIDHLSAKYHKAVTTYAGRAVALAIEHPEVFK